MTDKELAFVDYLARKYLTPKGNISCVFTKQMDLTTPEIRNAVWEKIGDKRELDYQQSKNRKSSWQAAKLVMREESETVSNPFICCNGQIITTPRCPVCGKGENGRNVKIENRRWICLRLYDDDFDFMRSLAKKTNSPTLYDALEKLIPTVNNLTHEDVPTPTRKGRRVSISHALNNAIVAKMEELNAGIPASSLTARATFMRVLLVAAKKYAREE
ncbi:MAG: hypothetical protein WC919_04170 [Candidatus Paceibacterota bacterium]